MFRLKAVIRKPGTHKLLLALSFVIMAAYPLLLFSLSPFFDDEVWVSETVQSEQASGSRKRHHDQAFDGRVTRLFRIDAPDGEAFLGLRFNRPIRIRQVLLYPKKSDDDAIRIAAARLQASDDGSNWTNIGPVRGDDSGRFSLSGQSANDATSYLYWRVLVEKSGTSDKTVTHVAEFQYEVDGIGAIRPTWLFELGVVSLIALSIVVFAIYSALFSLRRAEYFLLISFSLFFVVLSNYYFVLTNAAIGILSPDSFTYVSYAIHRTVGYPIFLSTVKFLSSYLWVGPVQVNLYIAACIFLTLSIFNYSRSILLSIACLIIVMLNGFSLKFGLALLTESLFITLLTTIIASMFLFLRHQSARQAILLGVALALLTSVKSIGPVIAFATIVFFIIVSPRRVFFATCCALPVAVAYLGMAGYNYARMGAFSYAPIGGVGIAGQVAPFIHEDQGSDYPDVAKDIRESLKPMMGERPEFSSIEGYYRHTTREYNKILKTALYPAMTRHLTESKDELSNFEMRVETNRILGDLAFHAILARPLDYGRHVFAHYCGLWLDGRRAFRTWATERRSSSRGIINRLTNERWLAGYRRIFGQPYIDRLVGYGVRPATQLQIYWDNRSRKFGETWASILPYLGIFSFCYPFWFVAVALFRRGWLLSEPILFLTLLLDAYSLGHALFQVSLTRYAGLMYVPQVLLALFLLYIVTKSAVGWCRQLWAHYPGRRFGSPS